MQTFFIEQNSLMVFQQSPVLPLVIGIGSKVRTFPVEREIPGLPQVSPKVIDTGQSISFIGRVPIEILLGKHQIARVLAVLLFSEEFQMEPLAPIVITKLTIVTIILVSD